MEQELVQYNIWGEEVKIFREVNTPKKAEEPNWLQDGEQLEEDSSLHIDKENFDPARKTLGLKQDLMQTPMKVNKYEQYLSQSYNTNASTNNSNRTPLQDITLQKSTTKKSNQSHKKVNLEQQVNTFKFLR